MLNGFEILILSLIISDRTNYHYLIFIILYTYQLTINNKTSVIIIMDLMLDTVVVELKLSESDYSPSSH